MGEKHIDDKGTIGEKFVNELAYNSFLKFWCYPGPKFENGDKKEICDLMIIFDDTLIIFSVKNYEFKGNHFRYFNNTIEKAVNQIHGACRILFTKPEILIKHPDKDFEVFPRAQIKKVFRIVVNLGDGVKFYPFNQITKNDDYVTLFDKSSFETIISELNTVPDFIDYLEKREELFKDKTTIILPGEEFDFPVETQKDFFQLRESLSGNIILISGTEKDLLSHFFKNEHSFPSALNKNSNGFYLIIDGDWETFVATSRSKNKNKADMVSYFIDRFVQNELLKNDLLKNLTPMRLGLAKTLLSFNRLTRRSISKSYFAFHDQYKATTGSNFARRFSDFDGIGILFTFYTDQMDLETQDMLNTMAIESYYLHTNYISKSMILISTNSRHEFKFHYIDKLERFSKSKEKEVKECVEILGWFTKQTVVHTVENEFPK